MRCSFEAAAAPISSKDLPSVSMRASTQRSSLFQKITQSIPPTITKVPLTLLRHIRPFRDSVWNTDEHTFNEWPVFTCDRGISIDVYIIFYLDHLKVATQFEMKYLTAIHKCCQMEKKMEISNILWFRAFSIIELTFLYEIISTEYPWIFYIFWLLKDPSLISGMTSSTVGEEKHFNPRLSKSLEEFVDIMNNLKLAYPKQIDVALPLNEVCGIQDPWWDSTRIHKHILFITISNRNTRNNKLLITFKIILSYKILRRMGVIFEHEKSK